MPRDRSGQWDIWVIEVNGHNPLQITSSPLPELHPSWSPDGKRLVYCRVNPREAEGELWISASENPGLKQFIGEGLFPSWSPQGDKIAYQRTRGHGDRLFSIWTLTLERDDAGSPTEIAASPDAAYIAPSWSSDGRQIAFVCVAPGNDVRADRTAANEANSGHSDIGVVNADGQGRVTLTNGSAEFYSPHWAADGRIFFTARRDQAETIWTLRPLRPAKDDELAVAAQGIQEIEP
jgi:TolB protein